MRLIRSWNREWITSLWTKKFSLLIFFISMNAGASFLLAQAPSRPKIGLTLSGGGAKGLAHIGLLKAIDSAGLQVDYVTGTSMGAIVGSLYATGYSGEEILKMARGIDWSVLLTNTPQMGKVVMPEKKEFGKYTLELPLIRGKLAFKRGILESNELWLKLSELFFPFYQTTDFRQFKRGFECIATDLASGEMVVLGKGDIVKAVRASIAIPSVFTPVEYEGKVLVDGGIVRNFPVFNVRAMGASLVIGSNVADGLHKAERLASPLEVMNQISFFKESSDFIQQKKLVDVYVDYPIEPYTAASFSSAEQIIQIGLAKGRGLYPAIKQLKDSLDILYGPLPSEVALPIKDSVLISEFEVKGLRATEMPAFWSIVHLSRGRYYKAEELSSAVHLAFGTRAFRKVTYSLMPLAGGGARIVFDVEKAPADIVRLGLHYNTASSVALKMGMLKRGIFNPFSTASFTLAVGENPGGEATFVQYFSKKKNFAFQTSLYGQSIDLFTYNDEFKRSGLYNQTSYGGDVQLLRFEPKNWAWGFGTSLERLKYRPKIISEIQAKGNTGLLHSYFTLQQNTLNTTMYPNRGRRLLLKTGYFFGQQAQFSIYKGGSVIATEDSAFFDFDPYKQVRLSWEQYFPAGRNALFLLIHSGLNFGYRQRFLNDFVVGGLNNSIRNQVVFTGLPEASIYTASALSVQLGYQHALSGKLFLTGRVNRLWYDFIRTNLRASTTAYGMGYSITLGCKTFLGPIEASCMYSSINKRLTPYFNIGFPLYR